MENCVIYSHHLKFDKVLEIVKAGLPKAQVDFKEDGLQKSIKAVLKGGFLGKDQTLQINYRERLNPSYQLEDANCPLTKNLGGMCNYISSIPAQNENLQGLLIRKMVTMNCEMPFVAEPKMSAELINVLQKILVELDGVIFVQANKTLNKSDGPHFADSNLNLILDYSGRSEIETLKVEIDSKYFDQSVEEVKEEQKNRKAKTGDFLNSKGIRVNKNLPVVIDSESVKIRDLKAIIDRAYALLVIAAKGEGVEKERLERVIQDKSIEAFSPKEALLLKQDTLEAQNQANATWRYESLAVLLWGLNQVEVLPYPGEICDVPRMVGLMLNTTRADFESSSKLRSANEILDELDKIYRMHWASVDARINGRQLGGGLNSSVVYERHYALNWLTNYGNANWDEVSTDT